MAEKLTVAESDKLKAFIGECVTQNVSFDLNKNKVGYSNGVGIQEVYNASIRDIETYGEFLYKVSESTGSPFKNKNKPLLIDGKLNIKDVIEALQLILQEKEYNLELRQKTAEIASITKQLEGMKSETEIKDELRAKLAALKGEAPVEVPTPQ